MISPIQNQKYDDQDFDESHIGYALLGEISQDCRKGQCKHDIKSPIIFKTCPLEIK